MRSFIAIDLSDTVRAALADLQRELKRSGPDVRWTRPEGIHLTLKFLGDIEEDRAPLIAEKIKGACGQSAAFRLSVSGTGVFPGKRSPRVLWAGIELNNEILSLQQRIEDAMASIGFEPEKRRFSPHLTLGRFRSSRGKKDVLDVLESYSDNLFGIMDVDSVLLMRSELGPKGAMYTKIAECKLQK